MKKLLAVVLAVAAFDAFAQSGARARPPGTMPLAEPLPPPPMVQADPALEAQGSAPARTENEQVVVEQRMAGRVEMQRVTPRHGRSYVLRNPRTDGTVARQDILDPGLAVPQWVLLEF
jgi:hypothetical protein